MLAGAACSPARAAGKTGGMTKHAFSSAMVPKPTGPYSAAVSSGHFVFVSGQPQADGRGEGLGGSAAEQARRALADLRHHLRSTGLPLDSVVAVTVYLVDADDAAAVDGAFREAFADPFPARTLVGVAWLPGGARVQIDALAARY